MVVSPGFYCSLSEFVIAASIFYRFCFSSECNRNFTNSSGYIFSPHYPSYYPPLSRCRWTISVPQGNVIKLRFLEFQLEEHPSCLNDFVEIYSGQAKARRKIGRYCGQRYPDFLESLSNVLEITFVSNANITRSGLKLHYTSWKGKRSHTGKHAHATALIQQTLGSSKFT